MNCPKCDADISDSYEPDDHSCGIVGGWFCDACNEGFAEHEFGRDHFDDDVGIGPISDLGEPLGTPLSELSGRVVPPDHPDYQKYLNFKRIARSWGHE